MQINAITINSYVNEVKQSFIHLIDNNLPPINDKDILSDIVVVCVLLKYTKISPSAFDVLNFKVNCKFSVVRLT